MAQSAPLNGRSGKITIYTTTDELVGMVTSYNISVREETVTISYMDGFESASTDIPWTGTASMVLPKSYSWSASCEARYVKNDIATGYNGQHALRNKLLDNASGATAQVKFYLSETDNVHWDGTARVSEMSLKATPDGHLDVSFALTGIGNLTLTGV